MKYFFLIALVLSQTSYAKMTASQADEAKRYCESENVAMPERCREMSSYYLDKQFSLMQKAFDKKMPVEQAIKGLRAISDDPLLTIGLRTGADQAIDSLRQWSSGKEINYRSSGSPTSFLSRSAGIAENGVIRPASTGRQSKTIHIGGD